jgi:serine/threonine protein kinase
MPPPSDSAGRHETASFYFPAGSGQPAPVPAEIGPDSGIGSSLVTLLPASARTGNPQTDDAPTIITPVRAADAEIPAAAGSKLGHYEILEAIGAGGMAAVLKARDTELGRVVALKILPPNMARDPENVTRFKQEARAAARLDHDNIARVFFCGEDRGLHFIAFEFVDGDNLRVLMDKRGLIPPGDCVRYMLQVTAGLGHAAARGVVHRDIKPSNIIITKDGRAKIVDMGLARAMGTHSMNGGVTQSGMTLGTFDYISPEQALDPRRADIRSDIYSLGCAFYHAVTGRPVVPEGTAAKKLHAHQFEPITDPRVLNPAVPDDLAAILAKMMAKDPARRYQTPADLSADLSVLARRLNVSTDGLPPDAVPAPSRGRIAGLPAEPPKIPLGLIAGLVGVAVAAAVFAGLSGGSTRPAPNPPWDDSFGLPKGPPAPDTSVTPVPDPPPGLASSVKAETTEQLVKALVTRGVTDIQLEGGRRYDLTAEANGVLVRRKRVTLTGVGSRPPILRIAAVPVDPGKPATARPGTLTFGQCDAVRFDRVHFEIVDGGDPGAGREDPVGVAVADTTRAEFVRCRFEADKDLPATVTGLAVANSSRETVSSLTLSRCYVSVRRSVGVRLSGRIEADVSETGFAPHLAAFQLKPSDVAAASELTLRHCTFLLENKGVVADADDGAQWEVNAAYCVFAAPPPADPEMMTPKGERRSAVLHVAADRADLPLARFNAKPTQPNAYYQVDPFAAGSTGYTFETVKKWRPSPALDSAAVVLTRSPWLSTDPVGELVGDLPWQGFRLQTTLRPIRKPGSEVVIFGVRFAPVGDDNAKIYPGAWPPVFETETIPPGVKVWWPEPPDDVKGSLPRGAYESLAEAIKALKPGDEIQIRHNGTLVVPPTVFALKFPVAIRSDPNPTLAPVLVASPKQPDGRLFQVDGGELRLEKLEIRLRAKGESLRDVRSRAAVVVTAGRCVVRDCVVTADDGDGADADKLAVVTVADPDGDTKPAGPDGSPEVRIENSLLRGACRAVWVQAARPADVQVTNTVAALTGPLLAVGPPARPLNGGAVHARLTRVTAATAGPTFDLHAGRAAGTKVVPWSPVLVAAERCVFVPVGAAATLVAVTSPEPSADLDKYLVWRTGDGPNWYPDRDRPAALFAEVAPADDTVTPRQVHGDGWFAFTGEKPTQAAKVTFAAAVPRKLATVRGSDFKVSETAVPGAKPADAGADVTKLPGD